MKKLLTTTAIILSLAVSSVSLAYADVGAEKGEHRGGHFMEEAIAKLPEQAANEFRDTMKQAHEKTKATHAKIKKLHEELDALLVAENFDKAAFLAKTKEMQKIEEKAHASMSEAFATAVSKLSLGDRKTLSDAMKEEREKHHHEHDKDGKQEDIK